MDDRLDLRKAAADQALADRDFGVNRVESSTAWDTEDDPHDEWTCVLTVDGAIIPYFCEFIVRFRADSAVVAQVIEGKPLSLADVEPGFQFVVTDPRTPRTS